MRKASVFLLFLSFFFLTLLNHGYAPHILGFLGLVGYLFIYNRHVLNIKFSYKYLLILFFVIAFISVDGVFFLFDIFGLNSFMSESAYKNNFVYLFYLCLLTISIVSTIKLAPNGSIKSVFCYIMLVHLIAFYMQFFLYYCFGVYIDFVEPFTGEESRYFNYYSDRSILNFLTGRVTGFYTEPSNFSSVMVCLLYINFYLKANRFLIFFGLLSLILNFSSLGIFQFLVIILFFIFSVNIKVIPFFIFALLISSFSESLNSFWLDAFNKFNDAKGTRLEMMIMYVKHPVFDLNFFGYGYFNIPKNVEEYLLKYTSAINDVGLLFFFIMKFGLVIGLFVLAFIIISSPSLISLGFLIAVIFSKLSFVNPIVIIFFVFYFSKKNVV